MSEIKRITLYKIKANKGFEDFLKGGLTTYDHVEPNEEFEGYIKYDPAGGGERTENQIPWLQFLNSGFPEKKYTYQAFNKFPRALMALRVIGKEGAEDVFYVATFGQHGDSSLDKEQIVYDFGIKVGMNICDAEKLRRIQTAAHEAVSRQTERQASTGTSLGVFGINTDTEFLRTISGSVKKEYLTVVDAFRGKDSIQIKFPKDQKVTWSHLVLLCRKLEERYWSDDYTKTDLKVYDILRHESDPVVIAELNKKLCAAIAAKDFACIHLAPPEFRISDGNSFAYEEKNSPEDVTPPTSDDLRIADLVSVKRRRLKNLDEHRIKGWKIFEYNPDLDRTFPLWDAYRCIVAEIDLHGRAFVLSSGQWREVSEELKQLVDEYFQNHDLVQDPDYLPHDVNIYNAARKENREELFNQRAAEVCAELYLLDKAKLEIAGQRRYEVCDLLHANRSIIHVKRYSSGAASISHLFTQGKFYAHAFSTDAACRTGMVNWINGDTDPTSEAKDKSAFIALIPEKKTDLDEKRYTVIFCILHDGQEFSLDQLPFMSRYELMLSHRFLTDDRSFAVGVVFRRVLLGP
ncbi:DUF6119 family protein [Rhizobium laguerreae]|uniref:DUF6119 family protein n=1 Tax=Rhizobium laguerreae TaxID=1076926 RepID=UPI001C91B776|nr:DUF6119 family protein [Rhizobium laguerreae]MBY3202003.1 TIGR04141 family sporadically distributed protein [Rhizobium laguerreae]